MVNRRGTMSADYYKSPKPMNNMRFHVCVPIEKMFEMLQKGESLPLSGTPLEQFHDLIDAQNKGQKFYTGCDSTKPDGSCLGHTE